MPLSPLNGVDLYWEASGEGNLVVLTHGSLTDGRSWQSVVDLLSDRFETITWDRRGHSRSSDGEGGGSYREDAADLAALIERLDGSPAFVVGNSWGATVVLALIADRPDLVKKAAVHEPDLIGFLGRSNPAKWGLVLEEERRGWRHVFELIESGHRREGVRYFLDQMAVGPGAFDMLAEPMRDMLIANAGTFLDEGEEPFDPDAVDLDAVGEASTPLMISRGSESPRLLAATALALCEALPLARAEVIEGAGHIPHRTDPETYAGLLASFFEPKDAS